MWSIVWWLFLLLLVIFFSAGWIVCFFVMRNNPKYFGIDKMLKAGRDDLVGLGRSKLVELKTKIDNAIKTVS